MDEMGVAISKEESTRIIIVNWTLLTHYKMHPSRQEWVSIVECICADDTTVLPCFIFKGEAVNTNLAKDKDKH
jgi:hypothetical protein